MFCPKCGEEIKDGSKFCKHCGSEIKKNNNANSTTTTVSKQPSNDDRNKKIIIGVLVAAIVILAVVSVSMNSFPVSEAPALAQAIKNSGGNFPVSFQSLSLSKAQCLYVLSKSITSIANGHPDATISIGQYSYAPHPSGNDNSQTIARENYVDMCKRFSSWMESNNAAPNYVGVFTGGVPDISPTKMLDICVSILIDYGNTHNLPASVKL